MPTVTGIATEFITFTRASNATVTDSDGKVKWAAHNLLTNSESFDASAWVKTGLTVTAANGAVAPNGTTTADTITLGAGTAGKIIYQVSAADTNQRTAGFYVKIASGAVRYLQILQDNNANAFANFDIVGNVVGTKGTSAVSSAITPIGSDWYYISASFTGAGNSVWLQAVDSQSATYNQTAAATGTFHLWGAHLYRSDLGGMQPNTSAYPMYNPTTVKNLLGYTENLTTGWTNSNTTDAIVSEVNPVGLTGAVDVAATAGNGTLLSSLSLLASPYTFSVWLKRKTGSGTVEITVDGTTYVTAAVTGTWTRFSTTLTPTAGTKTPGIRLVTSGDAVYAWGAQLSDSASLDTYSPVYGAAVTSAAYYGPRRDFDPVTLACKGLLVEEQRTNSLLHTAAFDNAAWGKDSLLAFGSGSTVNATTAPDGTVTADLITSASATAATGIGNSSISLSATAHTWSIYIKPNGVRYVQLLWTSSASTNYANFDLQSTTYVPTAGTYTAATIAPVSNGFFRVTITSTVAAVSGGPFCWFINSGSAARGASFTGDGTSGVFIWGAQLEANASFATSYIPTGAATATRSADAGNVSTQAFPYSSTEGTIVVAWQLAQLSGSPAAIHLTDAAESNRIRINAHLAGLNRSTITAAGALVDNIDTSTAATGITKYAIGGKSADYAVYRNGSAGGTSANAGFPSGCTEMRIGRDAATGNFNGHIRQITYLPRRISNTDLVTRTSA